MIKKIKNLYYNYQQKQINKEYEKNGLTDSVLDSQIALNRKRNSQDIFDSKEVVSQDDDGKYVQ